MCGARVFILHKNCIHNLQTGFRALGAASGVPTSHTIASADHGDAIESASPFRIFSAANYSRARRTCTLSSVLFVCIELIRYKLSCSRQQRQQNTETMMIFGAAAKQSWPFCIRNSQRLFHVYCEIVCCTRARVSMAVLTAINGARESSWGVF